MHCCSSSGCHCCRFFGHAAAVADWAAAASINFFFFCSAALLLLMGSERYQGAGHIIPNDPRYNDKGSFTDFQDYPEDPPFARAVGRLLKEAGARSMLDVGSGSGYLANIVAEMSGVDVVGVDGNHDVPQGRQYTKGSTSFRELDLTERFPADLVYSRAFDWVVSIAVAEHIPWDLEHLYLANIIRASVNAQGFVLVWDSRGVAGTGHVNTRNEDEVLRMFATLGFSLDVNKTVRLQRWATKRWLRLALVFKPPRNDEVKFSRIMQGTRIQFRNGESFFADSLIMARGQVFHIEWRRLGRVWQGPKADRMTADFRWSRPEYPHGRAPTRDSWEDIHGNWVDHDGSHVYLSCEEVVGPNAELYPARVMDGCIDIWGLAFLVYKEHQRACWGAMPPEINKLDCCTGKLQKIQGMNVCFSEGYARHVCCAEEPAFSTYGRQKHGAFLL